MAARVDAGETPGIMRVVDNTVMYVGQFTRKALVALVFLSACTKVDGGAAELSWKLRPASSSLTDKFVDCDSTVVDDATDTMFTLGVKKIRLDWQSQGVMGPGEEWSCRDSQGVTGFELPPGETLLWVTPICETGPAAAGTFVAPAPERRTVITGDTVSLGAIELILQVSSCTDQPCVCQ